MPKVLGLVQSCGECQHYGYYSGGQYECGLVDQIVEDKTVVAPFCPLADFPSRVLADMGSTIRTLQEPYKYGIVLSILSHVAAKFKTTMSTQGAVALPLKSGETVYLYHDHITEMDTHTWAIYFVCNGKKYKLYADAHPPGLLEETEVEGMKSGPLWTGCELA